MFRQRSKNMKLIIKDNYDAMSAWAAQHIANAINNHKEDRPFILGLPTGSSLALRLGRQGAGFQGKPVFCMLLEGLSRHGYFLSSRTADLIAILWMRHFQACLSSKTCS